MDEIIKSVEEISTEWNSFVKKQKNQEEEINNIKIELKNINIGERNMEEILQMNSAQDLGKKDNLASFMKGNLNPQEVKAFSSDDAERGGFAISPERCNEIISKIELISPMRKLASAQTISSNVLELLVQDGGFDSGWVAERDARNETNTPKLIQKRINVHEIYSQPKATQRLLDDNSMGVDKWLTEQLVQTFAREENKAFITGDGVNKPKGFLSYDDEIEKIEGDDEAKVGIEDLLNLINSLNETYHPGAVFLMNRRTLSAIQGLKDAEDRFIWQSSLSEKMADTLFGIPVYCSADMPNLEAGKSVIAFANFKAGYKIVDRQGIAVMRDPYTEKPFTKFYATKRVGGDVVNFDAIKLLKV